MGEAGRGLYPMNALEIVHGVALQSATFPVSDWERARESRHSKRETEHSSAVFIDSDPRQKRGKQTPTQLSTRQNFVEFILFYVSWYFPHTHTLCACVWGAVLPFAINFVQNKSWFIRHWMSVIVFRGLCFADFSVWCFVVVVLWFWGIRTKRTAPNPF